MSKTFDIKIKLYVLQFITWIYILFLNFFEIIKNKITYKKKPMVAKIYPIINQYYVKNLNISGDEENNIFNFVNYENFNYIAINIYNKNNKVFEKIKIE